MSENKNEVIAQNTSSKTFQSALAKTQSVFTNSVIEAGQKIDVVYDEEQKVCVSNVIGEMYTLAVDNELDIGKMDTNNIISILQTVAMLRINITSRPREGYLIVRKKGEKKIFEFGIEGDGNDKILREYGVDVEKVYPYWAVREKDDFKYPSFSGIEVTPPTWQPNDYTSKVIRVVYPMKMKDGTLQFLISEREEVRYNLLAHISNNLMFDKSGKKGKLLSRIENMSIDTMIKDVEVIAEISPAWKGAHSSEAIILRKMRNNATKKFPKDFKNAFASKAYETTFEDYDQYQIETKPNQEDIVDIEVTEKAQTEPITATIEVTNTNTPTDSKTSPKQSKNDEDVPF